MNDRRLLKHLEAVAGRIRLVRLGMSLALVWLLAAVAAAGLLWLNRSSGWNVSLVPPVLGIIALVAAASCVLLVLRSARDYHWVAQRIESHYPDLNSSLLTAIELKPDLPDGHYGYLQESVLRQAFYHAYIHRWSNVVPTWRLVMAHAANGVGVLALVAAMLALVFLAAPPPAPPVTLPFQQVSIVDAVYKATIEPGSTEVERGASLLVLARFEGSLPPDASLIYQLAGEDEERVAPMSKSLDDPVFGGRIPAVEQPLSYRVTYGGTSSETYAVTVFEYPELVRADANLSFPEYTKLEPRLIQDVRRISAVEGAVITLSCVLNKPVAQAQLVEKDGTVKDGTVLELVDLSDSTRAPSYQAFITLDRSRRMELKLVDREGRTNRSTTEFVFNALPNKPPELKLVAPKRDVQVSPIEELDLKATAWDDYGLARAGLSYSVPGIADGEVVLADASAAKENISLAHLLAFEELKAEPDQLLAYYFWAEDAGPDGQVRRISGDMYFAEVRHFEEIFRQGQQPTEGEAQQQQQQQQQQGSQNAQQAEQLAELQKQIINGTWKVMRREISAEPSDAFADDVLLLVESQISALEQATGLAEQIEDQQSLVHVEAVKQQMQTAVLELTKAHDGPEIPALKPALSAEQAAYQSLLRLRAREHEVVRANRQQQQQQQQSSSASSASSRAQQQLQQLDLREDENRYETQQTARPLENQEQREDRQVLNRLRELAQRQGDLNERIKELQSALEEAQSQQAREEIERQLKRLRDEQQQILRDTEELQQRMESPENQQRMNEERQQLEQARENARQASEALEQGQVSRAAAEGTRAERELRNLRDEFQERTAGQFAEEMREMREQARQLEESEQQIAERLAELTREGQQSNSLRDPLNREQVTEDLERQQRDLQNLLDRMQETGEAAIASEPLLADKLEETLRENRLQDPGRALESTRQSLNRGLPEDARNEERRAGEGISQLREGVDQAAEQVLGDETEALRRANEELQRLNEELRGEIARANPEEEGQRDGETEGQRDGEPQNGNQPQEGQPGQNQPSQNQPRENQPGENQPGQNQPGQNQPGQNQPGQNQPGQNQPGENQPGQNQPGQNQPGENQPGQRPGQIQPGQRNGDDRTASGPRGLDEFIGGGGNERVVAPIGGNDYLDWSDRLRDVEEMIADPELRAEAARIRDRAKEIRKDVKRHSEAPNWDLVRMTVAAPLAELQQRVAEELLRRSSRDALVPIDRDPVPARFEEQVRRYYERLGAGHD